MSAPANEKKTIASPVAVAVHTTQIHEKSSSETMGSRTLSPPNDNDRNRSGVGRCSDVSTPTSATANLNPFDTDIEAMAMHPTDTRELSHPQTRSGLVRCSTNLVRDGSNQDCQVWPGRDHWKTKAKARKRKNATCNCLSSLSYRNRMIVKILIVVFILCLGVGVGLGVSRSLNARIWTGNQ